MNPAIHFVIGSNLNTRNAFGKSAISEPRTINPNWPMNNLMISNGQSGFYRFSIMNKSHQLSFSNMFVFRNHLILHILRHRCIFSKS